jgi:hypothetical protein
VLNGPDAQRRGACRICESASSTAESNPDFVPSTSRMMRRIRRRLRRETRSSYRPRGSFARLRRLTSSQGTVFAAPESSSAIRLSISASQAAWTPGSTLPPRFEIRESASASCSSTDKESARLSSFETSGVICAIETMPILAQPANLPGLGTFTNQKPHPLAKNARRAGHASFSELVCFPAFA